MPCPHCQKREHGTADAKRRKKPLPIVRRVRVAGPLGAGRSSIPPAEDRSDSHEGEGDRRSDINTSVHCNQQANGTTAKFAWSARGATWLPRVRQLRSRRTQTQLSLGTCHLSKTRNWRDSSCGSRQRVVYPIAALAMLTEWLQKRERPALSTDATPG